MSDRRFNVLVVEDNPAHLKLFQEILKRNKVPSEISIATNGQDALDYLYQRNLFSNPDLSPRPDLILLDLNLPKVDGKASPSCN